MKKFIIIIILSILSIVSCTNESNNEELEKISARPETYMSTSELISLCNGQPPFILVNSVCGDNINQFCYCYYGAIYCACMYPMIANQVAIEPYVDFLSENNFDEVQTAFNNVIESINTEGYEENVMTYKNSIDSLEAERKNIITDWLDNQN